jgi:hypothetical protein
MHLMGAHAMPGRTSIHALAAALLALTLTAAPAGAEGECRWYCSDDTESEEHAEVDRVAPATMDTPIGRARVVAWDVEGLARVNQALDALIAACPAVAFHGPFAEWVRIDYHNYLAIPSARAMGWRDAAMVQIKMPEDAGYSYLFWLGGGDNPGILSDGQPEHALCGWPIHQEWINGDLFTPVADMAVFTGRPEQVDYPAN